MKDLSLLVWLSQLGLSVALPPAGFILLAVWLRDRFALGGWVIWAGVIVGVICAVDGLLVCLRAMKRMSHKETDEPPTSFNEHI